MDGQRWARIWSLWRQRWPSENPGPIWFLTLSQGKVKVGFWPSVAKRSKGSCFKSTKLNPRHSQTTNRSITDHLSINQNHQGPSQRRLTDIWKIQDFDDFHSAQWGGRWVGGQLATFPKCPETKFPEALHGQSVLSQKIASQKLKDGRTILWAQQGSSHYLREK